MTPFALFALALALDAAVPPPAAPASASASDQLLVVVTPSWSADAGRAALFEGGDLTFGPVAIRVGRAGLGWGLGEHTPPVPTAGPIKREGDGRAPAGRFRIGPRWDRADAADAYCVDDPASPLYTRIVRSPPDAAPAWASAEHMADYRVAIVVEHNPDAQPGGGSCIFLHEGADPTAGCTALPPDELDALTARLRPGAALVQLPAPVYRDLAASWALPALDQLQLDAAATPTEDTAR